MLSRDKAVELLRKYVKTENTIKHMLATEAIMGVLAERLEPDKVDQWRLAGLLHDLDYELVDQKTYEGHGLKSVEVLKEEGVDLPEAVYQAIAAHNWDNLGEEYQPKSLMAWSLFISDSLTGLIVATALVRPSKKLADVSLRSLKKKFKEKSFARGTRREDIQLCQKKLAIDLDEFMELSLEAMKQISADLGL